MVDIGRRHLCQKAVKVWLEIYISLVRHLTLFSILNGATGTQDDPFVRSANDAGFPSNKKSGNHYRSFYLMENRLSGYFDFFAAGFLVAFIAGLRPRLGDSTSPFFATSISSSLGALVESSAFRILLRKVLTSLLSSLISAA